MRCREYGPILRLLEYGGSRLVTVSNLPAIREAKTSEAAQRTAAHICAKIAANIAVGRNVKHFPRFYLSKNLK